MAVRSSRNIFIISECNNFNVLLVIIILFCYYHGKAQDTLIPYSTNDINIGRIRWVCQYPLEKRMEDKGLFKRIGEFIFGKKQVILPGKPISVLGIEPGSYWILDQGIGSLIEVHDNVGEIPQQIEEKYSSLVGICKTPENGVLFTDSRTQKIYKLIFGDDVLKVLNDTIILEQPTGIAYSFLNDEIWAVETAAHRISIFDKEGTLKRQIGKRGDGPGEFNYPTFIWIDDSGVVYIVDSMNFRIQILNSQGEVLHIFGQIGDATGYFARPKGIATDSFGHIYIVDALFHVVQIFDSSGNYLYHFGGQGTAKGQFWIPTGIYIDKNDYIYIADSYNSRIQVFQLFNEE